MKDTGTKKRGMKLILHMVEQLACLTAVLGLIYIPWLPSVRSAPFVSLFSAEPQIVSQQLISGVCTDGNGAERGDLDEWTSTTGACDKIVCHVEPSGNYTVTHSCRPREPSENPDTDNCEWISDSAQAFPDCCPKLECSSSSTLTTIDPLSCFNLASDYACNIWYNMTDGCSDVSSNVYNISEIYCRDACGLC